MSRYKMDNRTDKIVFRGLDSQNCHQTIPVEDIFKTECFIRRKFDLQSDDIVAITF